MDMLKMGYSMKMNIRCMRYRDDSVVGLHQDDAFCYGNSKITSETLRGFDCLKDFGKRVYVS
jgi:hypothetical protein